MGMRPELATAVEAITTVMRATHIQSQDGAAGHAVVFETVFMRVCEEEGLAAAIDALQPAFDALTEALTRGGFGVPIEAKRIGQLITEAKSPSMTIAINATRSLAARLAAFGNLTNRP